MSKQSDPVAARFTKAQDDLVLQAADLSLETIANMVDSDAIDVSPKYQRRDGSSPDKQRALIESFLLNVPIPPVYLFEEEYGTYSVIDGKQRIVTIRPFMRNELELRNLSSFGEIDGLRFEQMPVEIRNALRVRPYLRVVTLLRQSSPQLKYEVFRRLNEGGEPLNPQELRNVVYHGQMNELIYKISEHPFLLHQMKIRTKKEPPYRQMLNAEIVLRFFVLSDTWQKFSGSFRDSLDRFMRVRQECDADTLERYEGRFIRAISACERLFGNIAFKRPAQDGWRDQFLIGMF